MNIIITRTDYEDFGVFGTIQVDGVPFGVTCEQPWNNNQQGHSCIPEGDYVLVPHDSPSKGQVVAFVNPALSVYHEPGDVPEGEEDTARVACLVHSANFPSQLEGCVAVGATRMDFGPPNGPGITNSRSTLARLQALWGDRSNLTATIIRVTT